MIIKKYIVNNMNEAMNRIRYELGKDAVIISQRKIKKPGLRGIFSPKVMEVTAAIDNNKASIETDMQSSIDAIKKAMETKVSIKDKEEKKFENLLKLRESSNNDLFKEMQEMKEMILKINNSSNENISHKSEIELNLEKNDLNKELIKTIIARANVIEENLSEDEKIKRAIEGMISLADIKMEGVIVLAGPTGVGKTTTIAKMAGRLALIERKRVGLITIDTYRIGAIEQLNTYADIMNIPFKSVFSLKEMESALESMKDCDVILIDTTGRSSKNVMQIAELNSFIQKISTNNIHLVISATTKDKDISSIVQGYNTLNFNSVIITKLDETTTYGSILNILQCAGKPLSFVTTGQNVPDDFRKINVDEVIDLILGEEIIC